MASFKSDVPHSLRKDKRFSKLVTEHGVPTWKNRGTPFKSLVRSIAHQQVTGKAAESVLKRFVELFPKSRFPTPEQVLAQPLEKIRAAGFSGQKTSYIKNLAEHFASGVVNPKKFKHHTNEELIEALTKVKGIGVWTVHMFLMFTLLREDVLPTLDLGIKKGFQVLYKLKELPTHEKMEKLAKPWRAHASIASWYLWRAADAAKVKK